MPKVFVHGNPECDAIWGPLVAALAERGVTDTVLLSPPGFGAPVPSGFDATPGGYVAWLAGELRAIEGPIDLVGHDWGAGHVFGLAAAHPDLIRSYTVDCAGLVHPEYVWHDMAQVWQTDGAGEEAVGAIVGTPLVDRIAMFESFGAPTDMAQTMAAAADAVMGECILTLYRGAAQPYMADLGDRVAAADPRPAHLISALGDPYVSHQQGAETADRLGATHTLLEGKGHWWMVSEPDAPADAMVEFWAGLDE